MITKDNFKDLLIALNFTVTDNLYTYGKHFEAGDFWLKVDFSKSKIIYPETLKISGDFTTNFSANENFVVFECVYRLLEKGYEPQHIELEPKWDLGRGASGGRADILVRNKENTPLLLIECKTAGKEFDKEWKEMQKDGGQLFSYFQQEADVAFLCLYAAAFDEKSKQTSNTQRIISAKDNAQILKEDPSLMGFEQAKNVKERFKVWKDTYQLEATETGIFEPNISPYQIGKNKYTIATDTKPITAADIKGKYHQFRTILRKYNVSRRETAFEVLVNLFLCKLVDEQQNPHDLKFYWKGIAYDNYYDIVDRLQQLYKTGMQQFLQQDIMYFSNADIDDMFKFFRQPKNATKQAVKEMFRSLKFFKGLDFEFIKVQNKKGFEKNAKILLEIIQIWQGLQLKTDNQNQFLGDMFEYFLDNGIKQSEGQFFTPMPICKFILMSLPLDSYIQNKYQPLKVIDYACGSGHFLTEYALQVEPLVKLHKQTDASEYYKQIYGIEKEDRLAKVAKISAFMYGRGGINIVEADALSTIPEYTEQLKNGTFDILIANPPFAVEDFLLTLDEADRNKYTLSQQAADLSNKNIQCFFLERAQQLLTGGGIMAVVVPSSILSNSDTMHVATREILLKHFDFVSITELGSNTFGKTGTNTVVLFLRRKSQIPEPHEHFQNRAADFFSDWANEKEGGDYDDLYLLRNYCQHIDIDFDAYQSLLEGQPSPALLATEMFRDYRADFDALTTTKKLKEQRDFLKKSAADQTLALDSLFLQYLQHIEQEKIYYFMLAAHNPQPVLLVKSPADSKEQKQFLGYEWSGAKGNEGIRYAGGDTLHDMLTPMFDPHNRHNPNKIAYYIAQNFQNSDTQHDIPEPLAPFLSYAQLPDLLDFKRKNFDKSFLLSRTPKQDLIIQSKWNLAKIGDVCDLKAGGTPSRAKAEYWLNGTIKWLKINDFKDFDLISETDERITQAGLDNSSAKLLPVGTVIITIFATIGRLGILKEEMATNQAIVGLIIKNNAILLPQYLINVLYANIDFLKAEAIGMAQPNINSTKLSNFKIPLPPLTVQQQIVAECEAVDEASNQAKAHIERAKAEIEEKLENLFGHYPENKISDIAILNPSKTELKAKNLASDTVISFVEMSSVECGFIAHKEDKTLSELKKGSYTYFAENDIIIAKITPCMENGKCALATNLTNGLAMGSTEFHVFRVKPMLNNKYLFVLLNRQVVREQAAQNFTGSSGHRRVPASFYADYKIPVPPLSEQDALVKEIEVLEGQISKAQHIIASAAAEKQVILKKYLM